MTEAVDVEAARQAVTDLLKALGKDPYSEHLADTPRRVLRNPFAMSPCRK